MTSLFTMENFWTILWMSLISIVVLIFFYQLLRLGSNKESLFMQCVLFVPRVLGNLFSALTMDEKGYSLKKILAVYGTVIAGKLTLQHGDKQNCITFSLIWLAWAGILVGIYSLGDITGALSKFKGTSEVKTDAKTEAQPV